MKFKAALDAIMFLFKLIVTFLKIMRGVIISGVMASKLESIHAPQNNENFECFWCNEMDTQVRGYPEKLRILSAFGVTRWISSHLDIHLVTPKALKILIILWCMYAFEFRYRHPGYYDTSQSL